MARPASAPVRRELPDTQRRRDAARPWYRYAARLLPRDARARWVDFGCGQGEFLALGAACGLAGIGADLARANAAAAARAGRPAFVADLARPLPLRSACLDGASLLEVVEHIPDAEALARELARVIRPGGWLLVTTPNVAHWTYRWRALRGRPPKQEGRHFRFFTASTGVALFAAAGFEPSGRASFGKQALLTSALRAAGRPRGEKVHYAVPRALEPLLALHLVWRFVRA